MKVFFALMAAVFSASVPPQPRQEREFTPAQQWAIDRSYMAGVSVGGLFVMELSNVSDPGLGVVCRSTKTHKCVDKGEWMFDMLHADSERDWIAKLRADHNDTYTLDTMHNHWEHYIADDLLDALADFGVTHVRIPVGYWITEPPWPGGREEQGGEAKKTFRDAGFQAEGFATGGIVFVEALLRKLKARRMKVLVDLHAVPAGGSECETYAGVLTDAAYFWNGTVGQRVGRCTGPSDGAPYPTLRAAGQPWTAVGAAALLALANWVVALEGDPGLSATVMGLEIVNEPGLLAPLSVQVRALDARGLGLAPTPPPPRAH